ncbi:ECA polysaccharide chain length modulation protein [Castellaniella defragrans]
MNQQLSIQAPEAQGLGATTVTWQGQDPNKITEWLNQYVAMAHTAAHDQLIATLQKTVKTRIQEIDHQIDELRVVAAAEHQRDLHHLEDALKIAKTLQITKPLSAGNLVASYDGSATYLRGSEALQAEIDLLNARSNNDAYISQLPQLLYAKHLLQTSQINPEPLSAANVEQSAIPPISPIRPHKKLVIMLGAFLGVMIGVLAALIRRKIATS